MVHTTVDSVPSAFKSWVGCLAKSVIYKGRSAHAGGSPWNGCNALYAAQLGLSAINSIRETFKESDVIRVHPIITKGK
jgi:metal-dependent amidase/aminoacylase/carboxypeptidase family protein